MSADLRYFEYVGEIRVRRYSTRSVLIFIAGAMAGPIIAAPLIFVYYVTAGMSEFTQDSALIVAILLSAYVAAAIPILAYCEKKRLRDTSGIRGKKLVRGGIILYGLWIGIPIACGLVILAITLITSGIHAMTATPGPPISSFSYYAGRPAHPLSPAPASSAPPLEQADATAPSPPPTTLP